MHPQVSYPVQVPYTYLIHIYFVHPQFFHSAVRGHLFVSLPPLSSPTLPLFICISHTPLYHLQGPHTKLMTFVFKVRQLSKYQLTESHWLSAPFPACTSTASDEPQMHWDMSMRHYSTLHCHVDGYLWEAWYWEAWYCKLWYLICRQT
jgi:hypothetical protein